MGFNSSSSSSGAYKIVLDNQSMSPCQQSCEVKFKFGRPQDIRSNELYLTRQSYNVSVEDFYLVEDRLPEQLNQALVVSSLLIAASTSSGQAALIKMLFELEQVIEVHKYLNLELPVVFKEFIEALSSFRFMDITTVLQYDINSQMKQLSGAYLDCKGHSKIVYYESGVNFYKNIVPVLFSFGVVVAINLLLWALLKLLPCSIPRLLAQKIRIRWVITLSEMLETLVIPASLFFMFLLAYTIPSGAYFWVYLLGYLLCLFLLLFPFVTLSLVVLGRDKLSEVELEIVEDLLQDCHLGNKVSYAFYVYGYLKKMALGLLLGTGLSGLVQTFLLISINIGHLLMIAYIVAYRVYKSKIKILTRTINLVCVIVLEGLVLGYNLTYSSIDTKILIGVTCTYLTLIATGVGLFEILIKVVEVLFQKIKQDTQQTPGFIRNSNNRVLKCEMAKNSLAILNIDADSQDGKEDDKEAEYQEPMPSYPSRETIKTKAKPAQDEPEDSLNEG